jgi:predicted nuclease of predicted toxin-antitoxin system
VRILVDENIPAMTVRALRDLGHDVLDIRGSAAEGIPDAAVWELAQAEQRMLVTTDRGFALRRAEAHCGILVIRLRQPSRQRIHARALHALSCFAPDEWPGLLVVMRDVAMSAWRKSGV